MFSPLSRPTPSSLFLYEMAAHQLDSNLFEKNYSGIIDVDIWFKMYEEMRNAAYDTSLFEHQDSVYFHTLNVGTDTNTITIMNFEYYSFVDDALTTNTYFDFDTVNNVLTDKYPRPGYPFQINEVFAASPNTHGMNKFDFVYKIDPSFIFKDATASINNYSNSLYIDFDDGTGYHPFSTTTASYYAVHYIDTGSHQIRAILKDDAATIIAQSNSTLKVTGNYIYTIPDDKWDLPGIKANVYYPCASSGNPMSKILIYLEGIDLRDLFPNTNRTADEIYSGQIDGSGLGNLRNFGYTVIVVDWKNSRIDLRANGLYLFNLIDYLKDHIAPPGVTDQDFNEQFVIIGESMGGLVARYALTLMETHPSQHHPEKLHNTRLLMTFDTPHKGANIPVSLQMAYRTIQLAGFSVLGLAGPTVTQMAALYASNQLLDAMSAKQMLLTHIDTKIPGVPFCPVLPHPLKAVFDLELLGLGNYPKFCKLMAVANGSMDGKMQTRDWDGGFRTANDRIFTLNIDNSIHIGKWDVKVLSGAIELLTNCNGPGSVANFNVSAWVYKIKLKWFGIKLVQQALPVINIPCTVTTLPFCVNSGGVEGGSSVNLYPDEIANTLQTMVPGFMNPSNATNNGGGNYSFSSTSGGWIGVGNQVTIGSDGFHFCFVPTWSALDYATTAFSPDIQNENIVIKTASSPFGVIMGTEGSYDNNNTGQEAYKFNKYHLDVRNDILIDANTAQPLYYNTCTINGNKYIRVLNREIGDDIAYLDNRILASNWEASESINNEINVNIANPHYQYTSQSTPPPFAVEAVYSKENPYIILGQQQFIVSNYSVNYNAPYSGPYQIENNPFIYCCDNYSNNKMLQANHNVIPKEIKNSLKVIPNPVTNNYFVLQFAAIKDITTIVELFNMQGIRVFKKQYEITAAANNYYLPIDISQLTLAPGNYMVHLKNGSNNYVQKIIKL